MRARGESGMNFTDIRSLFAAGAGSATIVNKIAQKAVNYSASFHTISPPPRRKKYHHSTNKNARAAMAN